MHNEHHHDERTQYPISAPHTVEPSNVSAEHPPAAPSERPRIWVGSWLDYNNGVLHGQWIDAARDLDTVWTDITAMLAASPTAHQNGDVAEDWGIFDHDNFGPLRIGEHDDLHYVTRVGRGIAEHGDAFAAWAHAVDGDAERLDQFSSAFVGHYGSLHDYVLELVEAAGYDQLLDERIPVGLRPYVQLNTAGLALDLEISDAVQVYDRPGKEGVWVFRDP
ncbi:Antirestriction protein [Frankineae bacterium MT45]|nr:Antirestriction protein [Frankineae bacterium MT45]